MEAELNTEMNAKPLSNEKVADLGYWKRDETNSALQLMLLPSSYSLCDYLCNMVNFVIWTACFFNNKTYEVCCNHLIKYVSNNIDG